MKREIECEMPYFTVGTSAKIANSLLKKGFEWFKDSHSPHSHLHTHSRFSFSAPPIVLFFRFFSILLIRVEKPLIEKFSKRNFKYAHNKTNRKSKRAIEQMVGGGGNNKARLVTRGSKEDVNNQQKSEP